MNARRSGGALRRLAKYLGAFVIVCAVGFALWQAQRVLRFYLGPSETTLSQTGFDWRAAEAGTMENTFRFEPSYPFWSDGAAKYRYVQFPAGTKIDNSNPDRWNFPKGTRIWKVFKRDGVYVETRMLYKTGLEPWDWDMAVYAPRADQTDSDKLALSRKNVGATEHDIPAPSDCVTCHGDRETRRPLGLTAFQSPRTGEAGLSIARMKELGLLMAPTDHAPEIPGNESIRSVLGYLDTNCGSCHHEGSTYVTNKVPLRLNLTTATAGRVETTNAYTTAVNRKPYLDGLGTDHYVIPGKPDQSFIYRRMKLRDNGIWQMPPIATERVDDVGVELVRQWILGL
ncbi:MAG: hypothetical protein QNJ14_17190 [Woeseiaceae bacterium]|nr:hypothetical protein [Woeseiaceae bacterium]